MEYYQKENLTVPSITLRMEYHQKVEPHSCIHHTEDGVLSKRKSYSSIYHTDDGVLSKGKSYCSIHHTEDGVPSK
ncbi:hypothetical protein PoB_002685300, partial [Plakobranchus ocellatus]